MRAALPEAVHGKMVHDLIVLRPDLAPEQELTALVHELAHWLAHRVVIDDAVCTVYEYEAEAVEALVMSRLGLPSPPGREDNPTDGLLWASVNRVIWASRRICDALGLDARAEAWRPPAPARLQPQPAVDLDAAPGKEIVLEDE